MRISDVVEKLQQIEGQHGNLDVVVRDDGVINGVLRVYVDAEYDGTYNPPKKQGLAVVVLDLDVE